MLTRLGQGEPRTVTYMHRRLAEGRTKPEIIRSLKRYIAREIYQQLFASPIRGDGTGPRLP